VYATAEAYSGYLPDTPAKVTGFSLLHESGTGGAPKYGVVAQMPVPGSIKNPLLDFSSKRTKPDEGTVGYYKSSLDNGATVELAATNHAGFYQYTFPSGQQSNVVVDVSHMLPSFRGMNWGQTYQGGAFTIAPDGHYEGSGTYNKGWNLGKFMVPNHFLFSYHTHLNLYPCPANMFSGLIPHHLCFTLAGAPPADP
jgi:putative alpha-1,2-mannosidase